MTRNESDVRLQLEELCTLTDLPRRTVRYYIQRGLVERPIGETRAAYYTQQHVQQLLAVKKWTASGVSLDRISEILKDSNAELPPPRRHSGDVSVWSHLHLTDGLELNIEPGLANLSPEQVRAFASGVMALYNEIKEDE